MSFLTNQNLFSHWWEKSRDTKETDYLIIFSIGIYKRFFHVSVVLFKMVIFEAAQVCKRQFIPANWLSRHARSPRLFQQLLFCQNVLQAVQISMRSFASYILQLWPQFIIAYDCIQIWTTGGPVTIVFIEVCHSLVFTKGTLQSGRKSAKKILRVIKPASMIFFQRYKGGFYKKATSQPSKRK